MKDLLWVLATLIVLFSYLACVGPVFGQTQTRQTKAHNYCAYHATVAESFADIRDNGVTKKQVDAFIEDFSKKNKFTRQETIIFMFLASIVFDNKGLSPDIIYKVIYRDCISDLSKVTI
jgi:tetrahydromethanopterin S-methyltransferase subunit C